MRRRIHLTAKTAFQVALIGYAVPVDLSAQVDPVVDYPELTLIYSVRGPDLFRVHCAACHGLDGKGDGPMAGTLKSKVPDLTVLAKNNEGQFPAARLRQVIVGNEGPASHGSREMPVWGPIFHQIKQDRDFGNVRVENLVKYLQSIQQKPER